MPRVVVMGVAGVGKSTVGRRIAQQLALPFIDADDLHSTAARARMAMGEPLDDAERSTWIERVRDALTRHDDVVLACSALRREHRERLQSVGAVEMFSLDVPAEELTRRLSSRAGHFFPAALLASQLAAFDPPGPDEAIVIVDGNRPVDVVADDVVERITRARQADDGG